MALVIDATLAGKDSNSYVSADYCDAYWADHYNTTKAAQWSNLSAAQKVTLLLAATRVIDTAKYTENTLADETSLQYDYNTGKVLDLTLTKTPVRYYYYQRLQFPRNLDRDIDTADIYIPEPVKMAQCEQAIYLLNFDESVIASRMQGIEEEALSLGKGQLSTRQKFSGVGSSFAPMALEFLRPYFVRSTRMVRA